jgi:hypothetical protein
MTPFVHPGLLWGLLLLALPVLIHLINLVRQRRVPWAAMEFLLQSQRKNSTWIKLKELLLMLARMAAIACVVLVIAQPLVDRQLGLRLGGQISHHIVLLDDSFSMSDHWADTSAFDQAKGVIERLAGQTTAATTRQTFTLVRYSRAGRLSGTAQADLLAELVSSDLPDRVGKLLLPLPTSQLSVGPSPVLRALRPLLGDPKGEQRIIYLVSDFRTKDWDDPGEVLKELQAWNDQGAELQLINCVDRAHANLAVSSLRARPGTRAAGVPLFLEATIKNFSGERAKSISLTLDEDGVSRSAVEVDEIGPNQSVTRSFPVYFSTAGSHSVTVTIPDDAVEIDNTRYCVLDLPISVPVLVVDGDPEAQHGGFLAAALAPGGSVKTGISPRIEPPSWLNNNRLDDFKAIYLTDVDRLDHAAVEALERYVKQGGGLGIFLGPRSQADFFNKQLYRGGEGLFPLPLVGPTQLLVDRLDKGADLEVTDHPVFKVFAGERNSFLSGVTIEKFFASLKNWKPKPNSGTQVIARLRNGSPLAVEHRFGAGRVLAMLTTAAPIWNNWGRNPSFVVAMLEMQSYLASPPSEDDLRLVGAPLELKLDTTRFEPRFKLIAPGADAAETPLTEVPAGPQVISAVFPDTDTSGVYEARLTTTENHPQSRRYALNVDAEEGNLAVLDGERLATRLKGLRYDYRMADRISPTTAEHAGTNLSDWILYALVALLIGEQFLAYSASYHPSAKAGGA